MTSSVTAWTMPATGVFAPERKFVAVRAMAPVTGMPPTSGDDQVGDALRQQLGVRVVPVAGHRVGDDRREQALDGGQERDRERRRQQRQDQVGAELRNRDRRQAAGDPAELRSDRLDRQLEHGDRRRARDQRHDRSGHARDPLRHQQDERRASRSRAPTASGSIEGSASAIARHAREELARVPGQLQPEEVLDLRRRDEQRDAVREPEDDRPRDELHRLAEAGDAPGTAG